MRATRREFLRVTGAGMAGRALLRSLPFGLGASVLRARRAMAAPTLLDGTAGAFEDSVVFARSGNLTPRITLGPGASGDTFELTTRCALRAGSDGIDPVREGATLRLGTGQWTIPPRAFRVDDRGWVTFEGFVGTTFLEVLIRPLPDRGFELRAEGTGAELKGTVNPVAVGLTVGNAGGTAEVVAEIRP